MKSINGLFFWGAVAVTLLFVTQMNGVSFAEVRAVDEVKRELSNFVTRHGYPPDERDYRSILIPFADRLTQEDARLLAVYLVNVQNPMISKRDLSRLYESKIESISSLKLHFSYATERPAGMKQTFLDAVNVVFAMDKDKLFCSTYYDDSLQNVNSVELSNTVFAYNGDYMSSVRFFTSSMRAIEGAISPLETLEVFFSFECPLHYSFLLSFQIQEQMGKDILSLPNILSNDHVLICGKQELIDNIKCVVVTNGSERIYLDPLKDFSVVKIENYMSVFDESTKTFEDVLCKSVVLLDHVDYGNGIWFPQSVRVSYSDGSHFDRNVSMSIKNVELNKEIDPNFFVDVFPEDALVADTIRGIVYMWSDRPSIEATLKSVVKSKRQWFWQIASMTTGIILIIIWIIIKYVKYRAYYLKAKTAE